MSSTAIAVTTGASVTTAVGIATAQNASRWLAPSGWKTVDSSYSTPSIFTWFSPYRSLSPLLPCKTRRSSTTFCSGPPLRPCVPLRRTPSILARRSDSFRCSIPGARLFFTIRICIAWFRVAAFPRMARDGFPAGRSSSCLLPCWRVCFVDCSSTITNKRLLDINDGKVQFRWKDYRDGSRHKTMTLGADEFIRRLLLHVLPDGFQRIRYFGFLANRYRAEKLALCRQLMQMPPRTAAHEANTDYRDRYEALTGFSLRTCPLCRCGTMVVIETFKCTSSHTSFADTS